MYAPQVQPAYTGESAARQPEVISELDQLVRAVDQLAMVADTLQGRLQPVRRATGNTIGKDSPMPPEPVLCGIATSLRNLRQAVERQIGVLSTALNELEI